MTLVPTEGVVGVITKLHRESPEAAAVLYRLALFESLADQIDEHRPEMEAAVFKNMAEINATARRALLRTHVGKALNGEPEPEDEAFVEGLAILEEYVSKNSLVGWALDAFNRRVNRDEQGRFAPRGQNRQGPQEPLAHPGEQHRQQQGAVDLMGLALGANQRQGDRMTRNMFGDDGQVKQHGQQIANDWYGQTDGVNRQSYNRMRLTGQALAGMSAPGSVAHTVGSVAELAGNLGPEAETVLGPGIRRTAYRYRGTERRPEKSIVSAVDEASVYAAGLSGTPEEEAQAHRMIAGATSARGKSDVAAQVAAKWTSRSVSPDKRNLSVRGDAAVAAMLAVDGGRHESVLPDLDLVRLSLESGEMPPSQGVIIDSEGKVVTQAVGYNGDHYLPFDLRNLSSLHGGQYVRSRATGGPTTEDLYTGLLTGARQIQVVSNSGVFTIEFDPELRGGRRYNDKARRMIQRYGAMLETIGNPESDLFEPGADLPPEQVSALRVKASEASDTQQEFNRKFKQLRDQARMKAAFSESDMAEIDEAARNIGEQRAKEAAAASQRSGQPMSRQQQAQLAVEEARNYKRENQPTVRKLKLDGIGYNQAMKALKQEFPYFIRRADFQPLPEWLAQYGFSNTDLGYRQNAPSDLGYVQPGQTNTARAQTGARRVPTKQNARRGAAAPAAAADETPSAPKETNGAEEKATNGAKEPGRISMADLAKPQSPLMRQSSMSALVMTSAFAEFDEEIPMDATEEYAMGNFTPLKYLQWKSQKLISEKGPARAGEAFMQWFTQEATPVQVEFARDGMARLLRDRVGKNEDIYDSAGVPPIDKLTEHINTVETAYDLLHPFAPVPQGTEPHMVEPDTSLAIPVKMPEVPEITEPPEVFQKAEINIGFGDERREKLLARFAKLGPVEQAHEVADVYDKYVTEESTEHLKDLMDHQLVWSFTHAKTLNQELQKFAGSDAAPFEKAAQPRRRLVFAKSDPFFSSRVSSLVPQ